MMCRARQTALAAAQNPGGNRVFSRITDRRPASTTLPPGFPVSPFEKISSRHASGT